MKINELILYREPGHKDILEGMTALIEPEKGYMPNPYEVAGALAEFSAAHGFKGNLWHSFLAYVLATNENAFSMACEIRGAVEGTVNALALHDFAIFKRWFDCDLASLDDLLGIHVFSFLGKYESTGTHSTVFNRRIRYNIQALSEELSKAGTESQWHLIMTEFYRRFGVGKFGLHKAFRIEHKERPVIVPIKNIEHVPGRL